MSNLASNQQTMELNEDNEDTTYQHRLIHCALYSIEGNKHAVGQLGHAFFVMLLAQSITSIEFY